MNKQLFLIILFSVLQLSLNAQDCECEDETITLCYLSTDIYCSAALNSNIKCEYSLDGQFMEQALIPKLQNTFFFGVDGILPCVFEFTPLNNPINVETIETQNCDIIFTGSFPIDTLTGKLDFFKTAIPSKEINAIKTWSEKCKANLVITTQAEAKSWGYDFEYKNINPNVPTDPDHQIFNGVFGMIDEFWLGGNGVLVGGPSTGFDILSVSATGRNTIVLDDATNDIIMSDIGLFCSFPTGWLSDGDQIKTINDIVPLNLFAMGCDIAYNKIRTYQSIDICKGQQVILPDGQMTYSPGTFHSTLVASNNCDSVVTTVISYVDTLENYLNLFACQGDGTSLEVNGMIYDEQNPIGMEHTFSQEGCDSIIYIEIEFLKSSYEIIQSTHCFDENYILEIGNSTFDYNNPNGIVQFENSQACDSVIQVDLQYGDPFPEIELPELIEVNFGERHPIQVDVSANFSVNWSPSEIVACAHCPQTEIIISDNKHLLSLEVIDVIDCVKIYEIDLIVNCPIYVPNVFFPSSKNPTNSTFTLGQSCPVENFHLQIYDRWGTMVYESRDPELVWNGDINNQPTASGVYGFRLSYKGLSKEYNQVGNLTLIR